MNWKKTIGFGALIWALMFVVVSVFVGFNIYQLVYVEIATVIIAGIIALILAANVKPKSAGSALGYGLVWVVVGVILDAAVSMRFNAAIFSSWSVWLGYLLILLAPLLKVKKTASSPAGPVPPAQG